MDNVKSPCVRNCSLDTERVCRGCYRSLDEIVAWSDADDSERGAILERAAARRDLADTVAALPSIA